MESGLKPQYLVQDGARHGAKSVAAYLILGNAHGAHGSENGIVAHRPLAAAGAGKDIAAAAGDRLQFRPDNSFTS